MIYDSVVMVININNNNYKKYKKNYSIIVEEAAAATTTRGKGNRRVRRRRRRIFIQSEQVVKELNAFSKYYCAENVQPDLERLKKYLINLTSIKN